MPSYIFNLLTGQKCQNMNNSEINASILFVSPKTCKYTLNKEGGGGQGATTQQNSSTNLNLTW